MSSPPRPCAPTLRMSHNQPKDLTMSAANTTNNKLQWDVLTIKRPGLSRDLPAGKEELMWVANSSTLISGERDAVLVDTFLTTGQSQILLDWVFSRPSVRGLPPSG